MCVWGLSREPRGSRWVVVCLSALSKFGRSADVSDLVWIAVEAACRTQGILCTRR